MPPWLLVTAKSISWGLGERVLSSRPVSEGNVLARNELPGTFYATPALSDGTIYLRAYERLYAVGGTN